MNMTPISLAKTNALSTNRASTSAATSSTAGPADTNMFMTLLVAQLKNQDPLQPQDGAAFVAQLAQFNSLDQLIGIRNSIEQLATQIHTTQAAAAADTSK